MESHLGALADEIHHRGTEFTEESGRKENFHRCTTPIAEVNYCSINTILLRDLSASMVITQQALSAIIARHAAVAVLLHRQHR